MLGLFIEGLILIAILTVLTGEDFVGHGFFWVYIKAGFLALCTSIVALVLGVGISLVLPGIAALILGLALAATGLGFGLLKRGQATFLSSSLAAHGAGALIQFPVSLQSASAIFLHRMVVLVRCNVPSLCVRRG